LKRLAKHDLRLSKGLAVVRAQLVLREFCDAALFQFPRPLTLGKAHVVPVAAHVQNVRHLALLGWRWVEAVFECSERGSRIARALAVPLSERQWALARRDWQLYCIAYRTPGQLRLKPKTLSSSPAKAVRFSR